MRPRALRLAGLVVLACLCLSCGSDKKSTPAEPKPGTITAIASAITGQSGKYFAVSVFDFDWYPGAPNNPIGIIRVQIADNDYSANGVVESIDQGGDPIGEPKIFDTGAYSVVFFVGAPDSAPEFFAEIRVIVDGNVTAAAPAWAAWSHP